MAERLRSDLGFKPLYASLSFAEISTAVVYDTSTQQLYYGYISGTEGSYDLDFVANNIYLSGSLYAIDGDVTANNFYGTLITAIPDEYVFYSDNGNLTGTSTFTFNKSTTQPVLTIKSGENPSYQSKLLISGGNNSNVTLISRDPSITFDDTNYVTNLNISRATESLLFTNDFYGTKYVEIDTTEGSIVTTGPISASGDISSSKGLFASLSFDDASTSDNIVSYDTATGRFYYTSSIQNIDSNHREVIFNHLGQLTGSDDFEYFRHATTNEPYLRIRNSNSLGTGGANIVVSSSYDSSVIVYGDDKAILSLRNRYVAGTNQEKRTKIEAYQVDTGDKPNTLRFGTSDSNQGVHMRFESGPTVLSEAYYAISGGLGTFTDYFDSGFEPLKGGVVALQISASHNITASKFYGDGDLDDPSQAQFIGTASWALSASAAGAAGNDTEVQFNDNGQLAGLSNFTFNKSTVSPELKIQGGDGPAQTAILRLSGSSTAGFAGVTLKAAQTYFLFETGSSDSDRLFFTSNGSDIMSFGNSATPTSNPIKFSPLTGDISASGHITASGGYFDGDVKIIGTASVDVLITNYESSSIIYTSGSTKFGDTSDDTHQRTGSMFISGAILTIPDGAITASDAIIERDADGGDVVLTVFNSNTSYEVDKHVGIEFKHAVPTGDPFNAGKILAGKDNTYSGSPPTLQADSNLQFYITRDAADIKALHISSNQNITASGVFSSSAAGTNLIGTASWAESASNAISAGTSSLANLSAASANAGYSIPLIENTANPTRFFRDVNTRIKFNPVADLFAVPNISASFTTSSIVSASGDGTNLIGTASWAVSASQAISSSYASFATSASYASFATSASYASASTSASFAEFATSASYASSSTSASFAEFATSASYASSSTSASYALTSSFSENAATISSGSTSVNFVINAEIGTDASVTLDTFITSSNEGASYNYNIVSTESGSRTGTFLVTHWSGTVEFTDTSTNHIGPETQRPNFLASLNDNTVSMQIENGDGYRYRAVVQKL